MSDTFTFESEKLEFFTLKLITWYKEEGRSFPWRESLSSHYQKIITEFLLQRTRAETVANLYTKFFIHFPNWQSLASADIEEVVEKISPLGHWKKRGHSLIRFADYMVKHGDNLPMDREFLETLPGVGQYIASAILLFYFNQPEPLLDVNMSRLLERFFGPRKLRDIRDDPYLQALSREVVQHGNPIEINWAILDYSTIICCKTNPKCKICDLHLYCKYRTS